MSSIRKNISIEYNHKANIVVHPSHNKSKIASQLARQRTEDKEQLGNMDTGTTGMFFATKDANILRNKQNTEEIKVRQPDGSFIYSTQKGTLDIPNVGPTQAYIFQSLVGSLISISKLADLGKKTLLFIKVNEETGFYG